jgi:chromosome segregation ATPase
MVENLHATAAKKLAEYHAIEAALAKKTPPLQDALSRAKLAQVKAQEDVDNAALEVTQVKSSVDATNATLQKFIQDVHDASASQDSLVQTGQLLTSELEQLHKRAEILQEAVNSAQLRVDSSNALVAKDTAAVNAAQYAVAATSGAAHARALDTSAQFKAAKAVLAAVKANQATGSAHKAVHVQADELSRSVLTSVKSSLVALKEESRVSLSAVDSEHVQAVHVLAEAEVKLSAAQSLHDHDVAALSAAQNLQRQLSSMIAAKTSQLSGITSELEGLKLSIRTCLNSANDFQAKLNQQLRIYIQTLKKFQALRAVEEAAEAHVTLAQDALNLVAARQAKLETDEKNAEAAADLAVKKLLPNVPAREPRQVSKASPSK